jgi:hypothetical protein
MSSMSPDVFRELQLGEPLTSVIVSILSEVPAVFRFLLASCLQYILRLNEKSWTNVKL